MLKFPPNAQLKKLWGQCKLPNGQMFYYAQNWFDSLEREQLYSGALRWFSPTDLESIESLVRSADAAIKYRYIIDSPSLGETETQFIQKMLEKFWIQKIIQMAIKTNSGTPKPLWTVEELKAVFERIVNKLNLQGYHLDVPSLERLRRAWKTAEGGSLRSDSEW
jgi:hypothetical protein